MNLLVTGGAGFIGSNFVRYMLEKYPNYKVVNYDLLTYAGNLENLKDVENHPNYTFVKGDINNRELVDYLVKTHKIDVIVNFAAESHVDRSIADPGIFVKTNVLGTQALLDVAKATILRNMCKFQRTKCMVHLGKRGTLPKKRH
ncbi:dTDP-glucose 4,6-dehydratase [Geobacillus sp. BCO2]|nr:dTDP-glucose 4,6-dehydratase [Geobacillus sp. BCO2]